ncbi:hypothetical protein AAVH_37490, partial [Aphelenchoides avenae]
MDCSKQAAAVKWLEYCSKLCSAKEQLHKNEVKALKEEAFWKAKTAKDKISNLQKKAEVEFDNVERAYVKVKKLEAELSQLQSEVAKAAACAENIAKRDTFLTAKIKRKPLKCLDAALKIIKSRLSAPDSAP